MCYANIQSYIFIHRSCIHLYAGYYFILCHHLRSCFAGRVGLRRAGLSSVSLRLTAPSAEGAFWTALTAGRVVRSPALAGRGGSVSRRDLNQAYRRHANSQAEPTPRFRIPPNASRSSGGSAREGLLLEKPQTVDKVVNGLFKWKKARKRQSNVE